MNQKTVVIYEYDRNRLGLGDYHVGDEYILIEYTRLSTGQTRYVLVPHHGEGIGGNMNHEIKRYHGWRGTTDGIAKNVFGVRKIIRVSERKRDREGWDYIKVTVGKDIHPEWD